MLQRARIGRLALAASLVVLLGGACTPDPGPQPSPSPSVVTPTPTENAQEREQRIAYAAAEKSYREFRAEFRRVTGGGGASDSTAVMRATAGGPYLAEFTKVVQAYKKGGYFTRGTADIGYVRYSGYSPASLILSACEDDRGIKTYDAKKKETGAGGVLVVQVEVRRSGDSWKLWSGEGHKAASCE